MSAKRHSSQLKACRECRFLNQPKAKSCENCGSTRFAESWDGLIVVYDTEHSLIAKTMEVKRPGRYALNLY